MLDRRRDVSGDNLRHIMEERKHNRSSDIDLGPIDVAANRAKGVRQQGNVVAMLGHVLG
jgi:hypothetical protein